MKRPYYPALDGLRGIAILLVVIYHNFGFINYSSFGWLGVDLFFVLSGFLITDILLNNLGKKNFLGNFYGRRALRIFPLYYLALFIFILLLPSLGSFPQLNYYRENQAWLWTYLQNWLFIFYGNDSTVTLHHLWSLAVEEQFYLLWPLVILMVKSPKKLLYLMLLLLVGILVLRLWIWQNQVAELSYYKLYTFTRIDGLCIGSLVALLQRVYPGSLARYTTGIVLFLSFLNLGFYFINQAYDFSFPYLALVGYTTFAMIFGLLVDEARSRNTNLINSILGLSPLRFFGMISYGLYIIHWPLYVLWKPFLEKWFRAQFGSINIDIFVSLTATITAVILSWLSYRYYESYFLNLKKRLV